MPSGIKLVWGSFDLNNSKANRLFGPPSPIDSLFWRIGCPGLEGLL